MVTIREIAARAGVSIGTVSHVLNHPERVAPPTRERVQQVMQQSGWQPNPSAQQLRRVQCEDVAASGITHLPN